MMNIIPSKSGEAESTRPNLRLSSVRMQLAGVLMAAGLLFAPAGPAHASIVLATEIRALDLSGVGLFGPIEIHLTPGTHSTGQTVLAPDGTQGDLNPGNGQDTVRSSFFDVFFDISYTGASGPVKTSVIGRIAIAVPCENPFGFPPLPPGCIYMGHPVFTIEDVQSVVVEHLVNLGSISFVLPLPGFTIAETFDTTLTIAAGQNRAYSLSGGMTVDAVQIPEPASLGLVLLGIAGLWCSRTAPARGDKQSDPYIAA